MTSFEDFGSNPGALRSWTYVPDGLPKNAPLVVVLHGCTQTANGYDRASGWSSAAGENGFALLFPEQRRSNNHNLCFNWFARDDASRGQGEALSIRQMIAALQARHGTDPKRTFVTGLSAGGAMSAAMLATYPEVFAGGAVIAGLPFGTAQSVPEAFDRMRGHDGTTAEALADLVRSASSHPGPWPTLSVWHGTNDRTVDRSNAAALIDQWRTLHGAASAPCRSDTSAGYPHRAWCDSTGREVVEDYAITGMGHGTPLNTSSADGGETVAPYMLEAGISSTRHILAFWGIAGVPEDEVRQSRPQAQREAPPKPFVAGVGASPKQPVSNVQKTIEAALRSAGLLDRTG
ncbi:MAG: PHB depolymerase family esterase [Pseudomonadota bacterium]|nr:PHB depolymerase family esterase [Pseudomonadota bacterium]